MRLSEKQAIILFDIAKWSLCFANPTHGYEKKTVEDTVNAIINQQSDDLVELEEKSKNQGFQCGCGTGVG